MCSIRKKISLENLTYWNIELQEPYFSYKEEKREGINKKFLFPSIVRPYPLPGFLTIIVSEIWSNWDFL